MGDARGGTGTATGPTQMDYEAAAGERWKGRSSLARLVRFAILLAPICASVATSFLLSRHASHTSLGINRWIWWAGVIALSTIVLIQSEKIARRFLPLAALLKLSLVFPDEAPNRFKAALRSGTAGQMKKRIAELDDRDRERTDGEYLLDLLSTLADHDRLTRGHSERVRAYADMIAQELELPPEDFDRLHWAALLHDLGKLHVPSGVLNKEGRPTEEEFALIKGHPAAGVPYVEPLADWLGDWLHAVDQHHERWDGTGYPLGLEAQEIHLSGRIVAVADAFDVITSARSYKTGLSPDLAREEIARCSGSQFDPEVVRAFLNIGLGRLRLAAGPLAWLNSFPTVADSAIVPAVGTAASGAAAATIAGVAGLTGWWPGDTAPPEPVGVASIRESVDLTADDAIVELDESVTVEFAIGGDTDGPVTIRIIDAPDHGIATVVGDTNRTGDTWKQGIEYQPSEGFSGTDQLVYEVCEADECQLGTVEFTVIPAPLPPLPPTLADDRVDGIEDAAGSIPFSLLLANDSDPNDDPLSIVAIEADPELAFTVGPAAIAYSTPPEWSGDVGLSYEACDPGGLCAQASVVLEVAPAPDPPEARDDRFDGVENQPGTIATSALLANDDDRDGDPLVVARVGPSTNVTASLDGAQVRYEPEAGFTGPATIRYAACDPTDRCAVATVVIDVAAAPNQAPVANRDSGEGFIVDEDGVLVTADVTRNDTDTDSSVLPGSVRVASPPSAGTAVANGDGTFTYTPDADANGTDLFTYTITDDEGAESVAASVSITVNPVNDAPIVTDDGGDGFDTAEDTSFRTASVTLNDSDVDDPIDPTSLVVVVEPSKGAVVSNGDGTLDYTPDTNATGIDTFSYRLTDSSGAESAQATVTVSIGATNDAPVANDDAGVGFVTTEDTPFTTASVVANDTDPDSALVPASVSLVDPPSRGTATANPDGTFDYTPAPDAVGSDSWTYAITDGDGLGSAAATVTVTITQVNDSPSFTAGTDQTVAEDVGAQTTVGWATAISPGPADEAGQTVAFIVTNDNAALFDTAPVIDAAGNLTYTPAADTSGSATVTARLADDGGTADGGDDTSTVETFTITVIPVNDEPTFMVGSDQTHAEDPGPQSFVGWATAITPGAVDEGSQSLSFDVTNDNAALFATPPAISPSGTLTYTPAPNTDGLATVTVELSDDGGTANGGVDTSTPQTFTISVEAVNDAPSFAPGGDETVTEDAGPQSVGGWATSISAGPANEAGQTLTFNVVANSNPGLFAAAPAISETGALSYTGADDAHGVATITIELVDDGGTLNGGDDTSPTETFTITIDPVNDEPTFVAGADHTSDEGDPGQTIGGWATTISPGPTDEAGQSVAFAITANSNPALFSVAPSISPSGTLTYTPAADANGTATIDVVLTDNGGVANGGDDTSPTATFTITVEPVNDEPSFVAGPDQTVDEDAGPVAVSGWATAINPGPANESGQSVAFSVVANSNPALFASGPAVSPSGTLSYTPADDTHGTATITVELLDDGGTVNGGDDTSPTATFTITVDSVNDAPSFAKGADVVVLEGSGPFGDPGWATAISAGPANEAAQSVAFTVSNDNAGLFASPPAIDATGTLTFTPSASTDGSATVTVRLADDGGTANGGVDTSADQTFTITVTSVDLDGVPSGVDNCPSAFNPLQIDTDNDGQGDECDPTPTAASSALFTDSGASLGSAKSHSVAVGDLDGDGDLDAIFANDSDANAVYRLNALDTLVDTGQDLGSANAMDAVLGDLDGDGDLDVAFANRGSANTVWLNDGTGSFSDTGQGLGSELSQAIAVGDVDGDGDLDLITANDNTDPNAVWLNNGSGVFTGSGQALGTFKSTSVDVGDVDGDGDLDLVFANNDQADRVYVNDGTGNFTDSGQTLSAGKSLAVRLGDLDADGDLDLVVAGDSDPSTVWLNNGSGVFSDSGQTLGTTHDRDVALGDLDGDGDLDAAFAGHTTDNMVWLNDGSGVFTDSGQRLTTDSTEGIALGDLDGDSDLGIILANENGPNTVWSNG